MTIELLRWSVFNLQFIYAFFDLYRAIILTTSGDCIPCPIPLDCYFSRPLAGYDSRRHWHALLRLGPIEWQALTNHRGFSHP